MQNYYFYSSVRKLTVQVLDLFNNIKVAKYDESGNILKYVDVPVKMIPKEKFFSWVNDRKHEKRLPMMSLNMVSIDVSPDRSVSQSQITFKSSSGDYKNFILPTPYNFSFQMVISALYQIEIDQILEQILPFFTPHLFIRIGMPEIESEYNVKMILTSCAPDVSTEMTPDDYRTLVWNLDFMVHGFVFKPINTLESGITEKIQLNFFTNDESWANRTITKMTSTTSPSGVVEYPTSFGEIVQIVGISKDENETLCKVRGFDSEEDFS